MLQTLTLLLPVITTGTPLVDVTQAALQHRAYAGLACAVCITAEVQSRLVDWSEHDAERADADLDPDDRLDSVLAQASEAVRLVRRGSSHVAFLVEYYDREKRGNPRRIRLQIRQVTSSMLVIEIA